jgi:superfamily II DNA or RNA helicase
MNFENTKIKNQKHAYNPPETVNQTKKTYMDESTLYVGRNYTNTTAFNIPQKLYGPQSDYRPNQKHFFEYMAQHPHSNIVVDAPTGSGKSIMAMHIAKHTPGLVFIVTPTIDLMKQYQKDYQTKINN